MKNLCVTSQRMARPGRGSGVRCHRIPDVKTIAQAREIAHRVIAHLGLLPGDDVSLRLGRGGSGERYVFVVEHGRVTCRKRTAYGKRCG